jgi:hypothetical protein
MPKKSHRFVKESFFASRQQEHFARLEMHQKKQAEKARHISRRAQKKMGIDAKNTNQISLVGTLLTVIVLGELVVNVAATTTIQVPKLLSKKHSKKSEKELSHLHNNSSYVSQHNSTTIHSAQPALFVTRSPSNNGSFPAIQGIPTHRKICKGALCMDADRLSPEEIKKHYEGLQATMVYRRNPDNPTRPLMESIEAMGLIHAGSSVDILEKTGLTKEDLADSIHVVDPIIPQELHLHAEWKNNHVEQATAGRNANVFGGLGVLLINPDTKTVDIPKMNAFDIPKPFLAKYGAELIPLSESVMVDPVADKSLETLYLIKYNFDKDYVDQYALKKTGGGGLFVETHPFTQLFTPLSANASGGLILGVDKGRGDYDFAAFEIPFGYTLKINPMAIHGDSFFVGPYAIALTETPLADSVLVRKDNAERDIQVVTQPQIRTQAARFPLISEFRLFKQVHEINSSYYTKAVGNMRNNSC